MSTRVDKSYPKGDKGGNEFPLPNHYSADNLHSVWDKTVYEFHKSLKMPFNEADWDAMGTTVTGLREKYP